jgi:hypothetical protein
VQSPLKPLQGLSVDLMGGQDRLCKFPIRDGISSDDRYGTSRNMQSESHLSYKSSLLLIGICLYNEPYSLRRGIRP